MDIFNLSPNDFISQNQQKVRTVDPDVFDPDISKAPGGTYSAVLRFIPWVAATEAKDHQYQKYSVKITNPLTKERLWIDDPCTIGNSSVLWNIDTKLKKLKVDEPELFKELSNNFARSYKFYSLVYIKRDPQNPENEGKIKIFPHGFQIFKMASLLREPEGDGLIDVQKVEPFDLIKGRDFLYSVGKGSQASWRDFSKCKFLDQNSPLTITTPKGPVSCTDDPKTQKAFIAFLEKNSPNLGKFFYKEWSDEDYVKAVDFLKAAIPYRQILDEAFNQCKDDKIKQVYAESWTKPAKSSLRTESKAAPAATSLEDLEFGADRKHSQSIKASSLEDDLNSVGSLGGEDDSIFDDL